MKVYEEGSRRGQPAYHPEMMVKLLLYAYCAGVPSSRKIEKKTYEDVAFRIVSADQHPDHDTIAEFRDRHLKALSQLFIQVLKLCRKAGLVKLGLGHVALAGTKVKANASKHKARAMGGCATGRRSLSVKLNELLRKASCTDKKEEKLYGKAKAPTICLRS